MNRETIVEHVKARDKVIVWTASDLYYRYWVYRPGKDSVDHWCITDVQFAIKRAATIDGLDGGIWVRGLAGIAGLFPMVFRSASHYLCRDCNDFHNSDDVAEWMLLGKLDRGLTQSEFNDLPFRLTHPKRQNETLKDSDLEMTAEEIKQVDEIAKRHFEEDREEFPRW